MITQQQLIDKLTEIGFKPDGWPEYLTNKDFRARVVFLRKPVLTYWCSTKSIYEDSQQLVIQLSEKKTFDRWANSTNFEIDFKELQPEMVNLKNTLTHARKIVRSRVFDFNKYFHTIELDPF